MPNDPIAPPRSAFLVVFPSIMLPMFLAALDQTIVATALPAMASALGEVERVSWVVVAYLLGSTMVTPIYGRLGDALGRRRMMGTALVIFVVASGLCAMAGSLPASAGATRATSSPSLSVPPRSGRWPAAG